LSSTLSCSALHDLTSAGSITTANIAGDVAHANAIAALEAKLFRATDKLKIVEEKNQELVSDNMQVNVLKDTLRDRNNTIKDLKRSLEEREKAKSSGPGEGTSDDLRSRIADLMNENKTLKQALSAATAGVRGSTDRIGK
jgi:predicted RNase H-like nuclease (RuvC/YqgF family)